MSASRPPPRAPRPARRRAAARTAAPGAARPPSRAPAAPCRRGRIATPPPPREFPDAIDIRKGRDDRRHRGERVEALLATVDLSAVAGRRLRTFSGGMKRPVGLARALPNDPRPPLAGEPTAGLDPEGRSHLRNLPADPGGDRGATLSTQLVEDIAPTCRQLAAPRQGRVVCRGAVAELVDATRGQAWTVSTAGAKPAGDFTIVSTIHHGSSAQYPRPARGRRRPPPRPSKAITAG